MKGPDPLNTAAVARVDVDWKRPATVEPVPYTDHDWWYVHLGGTAITLSGERDELAAHLRAAADLLEAAER
jgi:hypothetical protein